MNISVPSPVFRGKTLLMKVKLCKVYTLECQQLNKGMRFASGTIKSTSLMAMGVNKYASTFSMPSFNNKKTCNHRKKNVA